MLARGYTSEYKARHKQARKMLAPLVASGQALCSRCGEPIPAAGPFDADERPHGFEAAHPVCNRRFGALHIP